MAKFMRFDGFSRSSFDGRHYGRMAISRGNASMNLRALMIGELFTKNTKPVNDANSLSRKDLDELAVKISRERSKREIKPALKVLKEVSSIT